MLDHISIGVSDREQAKAFYTATLATLGLKKVMDFGEACAYGPSPEKPFFWVQETPGERKLPGYHWALRAPNRAAVHAFHAAAISNGGTDDGEPGLRDYAEHYYAAFVLDPDGNKIEAVCFDPE